MLALLVSCSVAAVLGGQNEWHSTESICGDDDETCMPRAQTTMLLQTRHKLVRDPVQNASVLETCPLEKFQDSLAWLLEKKLLVESNITSSAKTRYLEINEQQRCEVEPKWYVSQKPLVINVGDGTTGTHFPNQIMNDLGFKTWHMGDTVGISVDYGLYGILGPTTGSLQVDEYDFISDFPAGALTWQFLQSHPQAVFLMTMRDPVDWAEHRLADHQYPFVHQGVPCGMASMRDSKNPVQQSYVAYSAWAKCVIPEDRFLATNFFPSDSQKDAAFVDELIDFLEMHGLQKPDWENRTALVRASISRE